jgi:hypothetical protein
MKQPPSTSSFSQTNKHKTSAEKPEEDRGDNTISKGTVKASPLQAWTHPSGSGKLGIPEFLDNRHMKVASLSAQCTSHLYPPGDTLILISVKRLSRPQGHTAAETIKSRKNPNDPAGNRKHNLPVLAQCVNQLRHRVP